MSYDFIPSTALTAVDGLTVPHHGGAGGAIPLTGVGAAVASYGVPNRYRHPDEAYLEEHNKAGWKVLRTAQHAYKSRGYRWL